ncbi:MAG: carbonic anhydrase [Chthoniobacterales bacterium]
MGLSDNWLRHVQDVREKHEKSLDGAESAEALERLCELNVIEQVNNVCRTTITQDAWARGQELAVHGCIYGPHGGLLQDLNVTADGAGRIEDGE